MTHARTVSPRLLLLAGAAAVLVACMVLDTRIVRNDGQSGAADGSFSAASFGAATFPKVRDAVMAKAVDATVLAPSIAADADAAQKQYAVTSESGPAYSVRFTGVAGAIDADSGTLPVKIEGLPADLRVSVQTGPAITGTDLRDGTGLVSFGQFANQIDYQNAGAALNAAMKQDVLARIDPASLSGRTVSVVGVFQPVDPGEWVVTPVRIDVR